MSDIFGAEDDTPSMHHLLDKYLEEEGLVATLMERIANLEEFRERYYQMTNNSPEKKNAPAADTTPAFDPALNQTLDEQTQTIYRLERQIKEMTGCQTILETEVTRLTEENDKLKGKSSDGSPAPTAKEAADMIESLQQEVAQMSEVAFTAMRSNADLGGVIFLLTKSFECTSTEDLAKLVLTSLNNNQLNGTICFNNAGKIEFYATNEIPTKTDQKILETLPTTELLTEKPDYLGFYTPNFQLLIRQFDSSDMKAYSDLKDTLQMLATGINASARRVISEGIATKERANLEKLVMTTQKNLRQIEVKQNREVMQVTQLANEAIVTFKNQLARIQMDHEQKNQLALVVTQELAKIEKLVKGSSYIDSNFKKVIEALTSSINKYKG